MANRIGFTLVNGSPVDHLSGSTPADWWAWIWAHISPYLPPVWVWWIVGALCAVAIAIVFGRATLRSLRALARLAKAHLSSRSTEDVLTIVAASIATGVSATGMWRFAEDVLNLPFFLRLLLFAFIEVAIVTSAVRARRNMRENFSAGVDGLAVWALTALTAVLSSMDASSFPEAVFRLSAPLVAAWLWERGMAIERHRIRGTGRINWRLTPERIAVRLGLAEASDRTAGEVDAHRRLTRVALAAKRAKALREAGASERKLRAAFAKLDKAMDAAVELAGLAVDPARQKALLDQIDALNSTEALAKRQKIARWANPVDEEARAKADAAMDELARLNARQATQRALDKAALALMASTTSSTTSSTPDRVDEAPNGRVDELPDHLAAVPPRNGTPSAFPSAPPSTPQVAVERVDEVPNFDVRDPSVYNLELMWSSTTLSALPSTPEEVDDLPDDDAGKASKTEVMRAYWDRMIAQKEYPTPSELARHAGASRSLAAELRAQWVEELTGWDKRRAKRALRDKASA